MHRSTRLFTFRSIALHVCLTSILHRQETESSGEIGMSKGSLQMPPAVIRGSLRAAGGQRLIIGLERKYETSLDTDSFFDRSKSDAC